MEHRKDLLTSAHEELSSIEELRNGKDSLGAVSVAEEVLKNIVQS